ncbi:MAG: DUF4388 domain-containing protein [Chloroflexota bacterium]|nr:DUF4388 domain-containing protein [Chloroflexota bacterium]
MAVSGDLKDLSLTDIIQVNCNERNQARLVVRHHGKEAAIFFEDGNIVHMELGDQEGEEVMYELLRWEEGGFELEQGIPPPTRTVTAHWSSLLLEGMQRIDESMSGGPEALEEGVLEGMQGIDAGLVGGPEALEEGKEVGGGMVKEDLVRELREVEGVVGAVIVARDGIVLAHDLEGDAEKEGAVAVFVGNAASQIGEALDLGTFGRGMVEMGVRSATKILVLEQPDYYVGLLLGERASPALIASQAENILK